MPEYVVHRNSPSGQSERVGVAGVYSADIGRRRRPGASLAAVVRAVLACWGVVLGMLVVGCSGSGPQTVDGQVSFQGAPVATGDIVFVGADGREKYVAKIAEGSYTVSLPQGSYKVEITAVRPVPGKTEMGMHGEAIPVTEQYLPPRFNDSTSLSLEVAAGQSPDADFQLQSSHRPSLDAIRHPPP